MSKLKVLLTGVAGRIGSALLPAFRERYDLRCFDRVSVADAPGMIVGDLQDRALLDEAMQGVDVVVHLAGTPTTTTFADDLVPNNIIGNHHVFMAAAEAGVRRIVYASSCQVVLDFASRGLKDEHAPFLPLTIYATTKAFGEILGHWLHDRFQTEFLSVRVGWFLQPDDFRLREYEYARCVWLSPDDAARFFTAAVEAPKISDDIVYATSITEGVLQLSLNPARDLLGYEPQDNVASIPAAINYFLTDRPKPPPIRPQE